MAQAVLSLDQGTTATKAALVSDEGEFLAFASVPVKRSYPAAGRVEQDPVELWESALAAVNQLPAKGASCLAITAQRESALFWNKRSGEPLSTCASWQCNRGTELCERLVAEGAAERVQELTGLPLAPMFSAPKLASLLDETPGLRKLALAGEACAGTVESWLAYKASGGSLHITDAGQASRTLLFDVHRMGWSDELLELFGVPRECLPEVVASSTVYGSAAVGPFRGLPVAALAADSHAAMFGLGCIGTGTAKATFGTGTSLMSSTGGAPVRSGHGLVTALAWLLSTGPPTYALEGNVVSSGATLEWVRRLLGLGDVAEVAELASSVSCSEGVYMVPAFAGLGAPYWQPRARAQLSGLAFSTERSHVARAALESVAFQVADLVGALRSDVNRPISEVHVDGGATRNDFLMQLQADVLGVPVVRTPAADAAALGAAFLAGLATGLFKTVAEVEALGQKGQRFEPSSEEPERSGRLQGWHKAVSSVLRAAEEDARAGGLGSPPRT